MIRFFSSQTLIIRFEYLRSFSITYLFPILFFGGELFRGYFLKEKLLVPWEKSMSSIIVDRVLETTALLATIIFGILFFLLSIGLLPQKLELIFGGTLVMFILALGRNEDSPSGWGC